MAGHGRATAAAGRDGNGGLGIAEAVYDHLYRHPIAIRARVERGMTRLKPVMVGVANVEHPSLNKAAVSSSKVDMHAKHGTGCPMLTWTISTKASLYLSSSVPTTIETTPLLSTCFYQPATHAGAHHISDAATSVTATSVSRLFETINTEADAIEVWKRPITTFPPVHPPDEAKLPYSLMGFGILVPQAYAATSVSEWEGLFVRSLTLNAQVQALLQFAKQVIATGTEESADTVPLESACKVVKALHDRAPDDDQQMDVQEAIESVGKSAESFSDFMNAMNVGRISWQSFGIWARATVHSSAENVSNEAIDIAYSMHQIAHRVRVGAGVAVTFVIEDVEELSRWQWFETFDGGVRCASKRQHDAVRALMQRYCREVPKTQYADINRKADVISSIAREEDKRSGLLTKDPKQLPGLIKSALQNILSASRPNEPSQLHAQILDEALADVDASNPRTLVDMHTLIGKALEATQRVHRVKVMVNLRVDGGSWTEAAKSLALATATSIAGTGGQLLNLAFANQTIGPFFSVSVASLNVQDQVARDMEPIIAAANESNAISGDITHQVYTAYGLSGSGKTHALVASANGFLKCVVGQLASLMQQNPSIKIMFGIKDIYGEHVIGEQTSAQSDQQVSAFDSECLAAWKLANPNASPLDLERATLWTVDDGGMWTDTDFPQGEELDVSYMQPVTDVNTLDLIPPRCVALATHKKRTNLRSRMEGGMHRYHVRTTPNNDESSRAHTVLRFVVADADGRTLGRISLIDMAGAEDVDAIQNSYYHRVHRKMVVKDVPAELNDPRKYTSLTKLVEGLLMDDVLLNKITQDADTFRTLWKPKVQQIKFKTVDREYDIANVGAWRQLRDSLRDDADKKDCTRVMRCPAPTENIVDLVESYCDVLDARCRILEVLTALTTKVGGRLKLRYHLMASRETRGQSFDAFWRAMRHIGDKHSALKGHASKPQLDTEMRRKTHMTSIATKPGKKPTTELLFDLWTLNLRYQHEVGKMTEAATSLRAAPGYVFMGVRDALISHEDTDVDGLIPTAPGIERITPAFEVRSVWTRLGFAMTMIQDGITSALEELSEYSEADVSSELLDLLEMVTGKRWGATKTDFKHIMDDYAILQTVEQRKRTAEFLASGGALREKIEAVKRLVVDHKQAMGKVHCPLRFQGKYIMSTLDDLKTLATGLSVDAHSAETQEATQKRWLRSALRDTTAASVEDLRLTQVVAIRTDFDKHSGSADDKRLRDGACQSLQFAANVNPLITTPSDLRCTES